MVHLRSQNVTINNFRHSFKNLPFLTDDTCSPLETLSNNGLYKFTFYLLYLLTNRMDARRSHWKSGRVHLAEGSNVVVLELPYSTEFGRDSRKFVSGVRKYGKFSHFLTHLVVYGGQGKNKYYLL